MDTLTDRITAYLSGGGLFNPELANHEAVRDLLIECRDELESVPKCRGIPDPRCNYLATCGRVCNKCGRVHGFTYPAAE